MNKDLKTIAGDLETVSLNQEQFTLPSGTYTINSPSTDEETYTQLTITKIGESYLSAPRYSFWKRLNYLFSGKLSGVEFKNRDLRTESNEEHTVTPAQEGETPFLAAIPVLDVKIAALLPVLETFARGGSRDEVYDELIEANIDNIISLIREYQAKVRNS